MSDEVEQLIQRRKMLTRNSRLEKKKRAEKPRSVTQVTYLGVDSNIAINGNPVALVKTSSGIARHELIASGQIIPGSIVNIAKPRLSQYGFITGMPR